MHKRIGILGGMSPESTITYYQHITHAYTQRFGDYNYPEILIFSVSFQDYVDWPKNEQWQKVADGLCQAATTLQNAGADFIIIATNTMHLVLDQIRTAVHIPVLSMMEVVADAIKAKGLQTVGLLGTRYTMEKPLYPPALKRQGIEVLVPEADDRAYVNRVIYEELVSGKILDSSRSGYVKIIQKLAAAGAQGIILGCTEIPLLINEKDAGIPVFDTTILHAEAALNFAIEPE